MQSLSNMMSRHANSAMYRLRPDHGIAFLDIEIPMSELGRQKACFIEEHVPSEDRAVLLPLNEEAMNADGGTWHPETFKPLGPDDAIWLFGYQGISPLLNQWLPLPYLRMMTGKLSKARLDHGPSNWVRIFVEAPEGPLHEVTRLRAVIAIDTKLESASRLDQRRYTTPSEEDVALGSTFFLTDDADQLSTFLSEAWVNEWLIEATAAHDSASQSKRFELEHVARYLFLLKILCDVCSAPILRFAGQAKRPSSNEGTPCDLILDLSDEIGLAVLSSEGGSGEWATERSRVLPVRDLGRPSNTYAGPLPIRVEFDQQPFGPVDISRRSGRSTAFNWSSLVRIGEQANRLSLRTNAFRGLTGSRSLIKGVYDEQAISGMWRCSSERAPNEKPGPPARASSMRFLSEDGRPTGTDSTAKPALRPRFSRASLVALFIAEVVKQAVSALNPPKETSSGGASWETLRTLRLSMPVTASPQERAAIVSRVQDGIDFLWQAEGWDENTSGRAPPKPALELGLGGDFGVQLIYLHSQLQDVYGGDVTAFVEDIAPVGTADGSSSAQRVRLASLHLGFASTRAVIADYEIRAAGGVHPRLVSTDTAPRGLDALHSAIIEQILMPAIASDLQGRNGQIGPSQAYELCGRRVPGHDSEVFEGVSKTGHNDRGLRFEEKILEPAARALLQRYCSLPVGGSRGLEQFNLKDLVSKGKGRLGFLAEQIEADAAKLGADGFQLENVTVPFSQYAIKTAITPALSALLTAATKNMPVSQLGLIFITSPFSQKEVLKELTLSLFPISPHRLVVLDDNWGVQKKQFEHQIALPVRIGILSTVIGKQRLLGSEGLAHSAQSVQLEFEVA